MQRRLPAPVLHLHHDLGRLFALLLGEVDEAGDHAGVPGPGGAVQRRVAVPVARDQRAPVPATGQRRALEVAVVVPASGRLMELRVPVARGGQLDDDVARPSSHRRRRILLLAQQLLVVTGACGHEQQQTPEERAEVLRRLHRPSTIGVYCIN